MTRRLGLVLASAGGGLLLWVGVVSLWQDPFTALYTLWRQHGLSAQYERREAGFRPAVLHSSGTSAELAAIAREARQYRRSSHPGEAMGRIEVPRLDLNAVLVDGTDHDSLMKGPGIYRGDYLPGEGELVYIAGHRTTYLAPFADINSLRRGDRVTIELPYGTFVYAITGSRIVPANDVAVLRTHHREQVILQACQPRFSATHRYLAYAKLVSIRPRTPLSKSLQSVTRAGDTGPVRVL